MQNVPNPNLLVGFVARRRHSPNFAPHPKPAIGFGTLCMRVAAARGYRARPFGARTDAGEVHHVRGLANGSREAGTETMAAAARPLCGFWHTRVARASRAPNAAGPTTRGILTRTRRQRSAGRARSRAPPCLNGRGRRPPSSGPRLRGITRLARGESSAQQAAQRAVRPCTREMLGPEAQECDDFASRDEWVGHDAPVLK